MSPRTRGSGGAPGASSTVGGREIELMPSCTVPMFSNSCEISHMIHCDMPRMRSAKATITAIAPAPTGALVPKPQRRGHGGEKQRHVERVEQAPYARGQAHLPVDGDQEAVHRIARIGLLALGVREQLHRGDVGVAVH